MDLYDGVAEFYDSIHGDMDEDLTFILDLASDSPGPILEFGCGTGRLLIPLARAGHHVTGVDLSRPMMAIARKKIAQESSEVAGRISLVEADMIQYSRRERYGLALVSHNTLMHLRPEDAMRLFQNLDVLMARPSRVFLDLANPGELLEMGEGAHQTEEKRILERPGHDDLEISIDSRPGGDSRSRRVSWRIRKSSEAHPFQSLILEETMYYHYAHELDLMLRGSGFRMESLLGWYDGQPFDEEVERMIVVATR